MNNCDGKKKKGLLDMMHFLKIMKIIFGHFHCFLTIILGNENRKHFHKINGPLVYYYILFPNIAS
jgi:hypothetical protein